MEKNTETKTKLADKKQIVFIHFNMREQQQTRKASVCYSICFKFCVLAMSFVYTYNLCSSCVYVYRSSMCVFMCEQFSCPGVCFTSFH